MHLKVQHSAVNKKPDPRQFWVTNHRNLTCTTICTSEQQALEDLICTRGNKTKANYSGSKFTVLHQLLLSMRPSEQFGFKDVLTSQRIREDL